MPLDTPLMGTRAVFIAAFSRVGLMTNQIHQWAHMRYAPLPVRILQILGIILNHEAHECHHRPPVDRNDCIPTGWRNRSFQRMNFFRRAEALMTWGTGLQPGEDDRWFATGTSLPTQSLDNQ